jgi:hypothetical protein
MFSANISALRRLVEEREIVVHQRRLDSRRWSVRRDVMRDVKDSFLATLEAAIAKSHSDYGHTVVLRTYSLAEWEETDGDGIALDEIFKKTDVLQRVANCLAPGFFKCRVRPTVARQPGMRPRIYEIIARFYADGIEAAKPPCTCVCSYLTDGFCDVCGGHNVRVPQINNPEDEEEEADEDEVPFGFA